MLSSKAACREYLKTEDPSTIARQLRQDQELCRTQKLPSLLALFLPSSNSEEADEIAKELYSQNLSLPRSIRTLQYSGIVQGIKSYLHQMTPTPKHGPLPAAFQEKGHTEPSRKEYESALEVLEFCLRRQDSSQMNLDTPLNQVIRELQGIVQTSSASQTSTSTLSSPNKIPNPKKKQQRKCYICQFLLLSPHPECRSLCKPCGAFNLASCRVSLPENFCLQGKTALVTGGRVNLGYHTALRLLRCKARVIVSTRYPREAATRYLAEKDSESWKESLKIVGADFRAASDVFDLISHVKDCLREWDEKGVIKLDILINNAAQTLTDPLDTEKHAVEQEEQFRLLGANFDTTLLLEKSAYQARIRGGVKISMLLNTNHNRLPASMKEDESSESNNSQHSTAILRKELDTKSSWMQSISQIPYEDIISAHSVNTFVPLILTRELLPLMGSSSAAQTTSPNPNPISKPLAHIINVSSREGIFESHPNSSMKQGHHVHTNLTKAALNMLTETEAGPAWRGRRVAMNTVDPGYMSAAPEIMEQWKENGRAGCPIGWEDGVGRVLWPIAVGEKGDPVWGRFLKHFGSVDVEVEAGR